MRSGERFLAAAADLFDETGEWPTVDDVQDLLVYRRDSTDAEREARRLSNTHGKREGDSVYPSVQGIYAADPGHPTLEYFERVLVYGAKKYKRRRRRTKTVVSRSEVVEALGLDGDEAERALAMLVAESLASVDLERDEAVVIAPAIRHYFAVRTAGEYVKAKSRLECRLCRVKRARAKARGLTRRVARAAGGIVLSALAIVLATFLVWLATQAFDDGGHDSRPPPQPDASASEALP